MRKVMRLQHADDALLDPRHCARRDSVLHAAVIIFRS